MHAHTKKTHKKKTENVSVCIRSFFLASCWVLYENNVISQLGEAFCFGWGERGAAHILLISSFLLCALCVFYLLCVCVCVRQALCFPGSGYTFTLSDRLSMTRCHCTDSASFFIREFSINGVSLWEWRRYIFLTAYVMGFVDLTHFVFIKNYVRINRRDPSLWEEKK